jgi:type I restriction-modification system DNA methylase subunit
MANERITEGLVRDHFKKDALFQSIKWEEQKSSNKRIQELLKGKGKAGGKGDGYPEFIVSFPTNSNYLIVIECKASVSDHESANRDNAVRFAVDGVLHYAKALSREFNVIAIAASGQNETELQVSHFYWKKESETPADISDAKLLDLGSYLQVFEDQFFISDFYTRDIAFKAQYLNEVFHQYTVPEYKRCTMASAMLLALIDDNFHQNFEASPDIKYLGQSLLSAINAVFEAENDIVRSKTVLMREFESVLNEPLFIQDKIKNKELKKDVSTLEVAKELIIYLNKNVYPLVKHSNIGYDVLGRFYIEFIRYAASEQKSGLVLTPPHITELFCDLAELRETDIVYDPCCGTGGFLVSAMQRMFKMAGGDIAKKEKIRKKQLCGCEIRSDIFTYACSSMRFRGDGKSNIYNGSCFHNAKSIADNHKPTVAFLNPPYDVGNAGQMEFIEHCLNVLNPQAHGRVVAIVQMSCGIKNEKDLFAVKQRILAKHHLKAVLSMPDDLFYPIGVVTCIMIFEANTPNAGRKTWFGYFKDDGFEKRKHLGRIDARNRYAAIKERWLSAYRNFEDTPGLSVRKEVAYNDEWCAEAYMETDYSTLCDNDFIKKMRDYAAFKLQNNYDLSIVFKLKPFFTNKLSLNTDNWKWFEYKELFIVSGSKTTSKLELEDIGKGLYPYVTTQAINNGIADYFNFATEKGKVFTVDSAVLGYCAYQDNNFSASDHVEKLTPLFDCNIYIAMFLTTLINEEQYRYNYGRKCSQKKLKQSKIKLPATADGQPDWQFMENYIKGLPYSRCL